MQYMQTNLLQACKKAKESTRKYYNKYIYIYIYIKYIYNIYYIDYLQSSKNWTFKLRFYIFIESNNRCCNRHLQNWYRITASTISSNNTRKLPAFSTQIIIFVFLTFTVNPFDSNVLFQASSLPFRPSSVSLMPSHQRRAVLQNVLN